MESGSETRSVPQLVHAKNSRWGPTSTGSWIETRRSDWPEQRSAMERPKSRKHSDLKSDGTPCVTEDSHAISAC